KPSHVITNCRKGISTQADMRFERSEGSGRSTKSDNKGIQFSPEQLTHMMNMLQLMKNSHVDQGTSDSVPAIYAGLVSTSGFSNCCFFACHMSSASPPPSSTPSLLVGLRRSSRVSVPPFYLHKYVCSNASTSKDTSITPEIDL
ncbi:hypothetical protein HAX54_001561, partial [Datura stramonium]|nr:hypothetical protein [Datura stramonium]